MLQSSREPEVSRLESPTLCYVAPFAAFIGVMALERVLGIPPVAGYSLRLAVTILTLALFSRKCISLRPSLPVMSIGIGAAVFVIWVGPDLLFHYRHSWLFENSLTGTSASWISPDLRNPAAVALRAAGSALVVPVIEELFWRGWLMRWLIDQRFLKIPLGTYRPLAFWMTAILFASEHGSYWEVGLAAGVVYNWWLIRTKNLADCILAHAVTNAILACYVVAAGKWEYWL